ncbi:uncharacterized protein LOC117870311 [Trachemys scripta elegans]|uniref:uncharacterized protein LOC117870311 n=1 Tax=Trachemys scripta elegans TaxID=31138 RepID=UPI001554347D|nr:uncharacterized protein LOC117870311 [Trachemys scripta elegans]
MEHYSARKCHFIEIKMFHGNMLIMMRLKPVYFPASLPGPSAACLSSRHTGCQGAGTLDPKFSGSSAKFPAGQKFHFLPNSKTSPWNRPFSISIPDLRLRKSQSFPAMGFSVPWTAAIQMMVLALALHFTAGNSHEPLIVLDNYEDNGIRVTCFSETKFSDVQLFWTDSKGHNLTGSPITPTSDTDEARAKSSILLKSGSDNAISCNVIDNVLKTSNESTVVIADVFFPATSPWMTAFIVILLISIALVSAAIYKLKKNNETTALAGHIPTTPSIDAEMELMMDFIFADRSTPPS